MSTATNDKPTAIQERAFAATRSLCEALGLAEVSQAQVKYLTIALAETATVEAKQNRADDG
jgi:hypothetical protein